MRQSGDTDSKIAKILADYIVELMEESKGEIDILDRIQERLIAPQERAISMAYREITARDDMFFEDPNAVVDQKYPLVDRSESPRSGEIGFRDLSMRSPYGASYHDMLKKSCIGFMGFGGVQIIGSIAARSGVGSLILSDPDTFEASNANRQLFCFSDVLGMYKADVCKEFLSKINHEAEIVASKENIDAGNVERVFGKADIIVDGSGNLAARRALHEYGRRSGKPIVTATWGGFEGHYTFFMPDDPTYFDVFDYSPYNPERGTHPAGIMLIGTLIANDIVKALTGDCGVVRYPQMVTINMKSKVPVKIRDIRYVKERSSKRVSYVNAKRVS